MKFLKELILGVIIAILVASIFYLLNRVYNIDINKWGDPQSIFNKDKTDVSYLSKDDITTLTSLKKPECKDKNIYIKKIKNILTNKAFNEDNVIEIVSNVKDSLRYNSSNDKYTKTNRNTFVGFKKDSYYEYLGEFEQLENGEYVLNGYGILIAGSYIYIGEWSKGDKNGIIVQLDDHDVTKGNYINNEKIKDLTGFYIPHYLMWLVYLVSLYIIVIPISIIVKRHRKRSV